MTIPVITIDGPGGSGKGTVSLKVAELLGWHVLDSGSMYRVLALAAEQESVNVQDESALSALAQRLSVHFETSINAEGAQIILNDVNVSDALRTETCGKMASHIAVLPQVRQALLNRQRAFQQAPGLVADGRDMGTVVFPNAEIKVFLTASVEERAQRRYKQLKRKGVNVKLPDILSEIVDRDHRDRSRIVAPLIPAPDAWIIDTTELSADSVVMLIVEKVSRTLGDHVHTT